KHRAHATKDHPSMNNVAATGRLPARCGPPISGIPSSNVLCRAAPELLSCPKIPWHHLAPHGVPLATVFPLPAPSSTRYPFAALLFLRSYARGAKLLSTDF